MEMVERGMIEMTICQNNRGCGEIEEEETREEDKLLTRGGHFDCPLSITFNDDVSNPP